MADTNLFSYIPLHLINVYLVATKWSVKHDIFDWDYKHLKMVQNWPTKSLLRNGMDSHYQVSSTNLAYMRMAMALGVIAGKSWFYSISGLILYPALYKAII